MIWINCNPQAGREMKDVHHCVRGIERDMSASSPAAAPLLRNRRSGVGASLRLKRNRQLARGAQLPLAVA
jgi:hypothetical protein